MNPPEAPQSGRPRLMDQVREQLRVKHYSIRTEQVYMDWIKRFILFHGKRHPEAMGASVICVHKLRLRRSEAIGGIISRGFQPHHQPLAKQLSGSERPQTYDGAELPW